MTRRWPRQAATLQEMVNEHGQMLRGLSYGELQALSEPMRHFQIEGRKARIATIAEKAGDEVRVVVQGLVKALIGYHVALDGFYKGAQGGVRDMPEEEFSNYD
jgi:hypothetical protein